MGIDQIARERALELLRKDANADDAVFIPEAAIGLAIPLPGDGPEAAGDREPHDPKIPSNAGAMALELASL